MKSKVSLALTELCVMLLVLALASALCLRVFVWADETSQKSAARDDALIYMQSVAEMLKATGSPEDTVLALGGSRTENYWQIPGEIFDIRIIATETAEDNLRSVSLEAVYQDTVLIRFPVSWQEVAQ